MRPNVTRPTTSTGAPVFVRRSYWTARVGGGAPEVVRVHGFLHDVVPGEVWLGVTLEDGGTLAVHPSTLAAALDGDPGTAHPRARLAALKRTAPADLLAMGAKALAAGGEAVARFRAPLREWTRAVRNTMGRIEGPSATAVRELAVTLFAIECEAAR